ncbi:MAG: NUDIX domain-containing protein [Bacilli bacterium]
MKNNKQIQFIHPSIKDYYLDLEYQSIITARAIILQGNKLLMIHTDTYDDYTFPGGTKEDDEAIEVTLERELREETGANDLVSAQLYLETIEYLPSVKNESKYNKRVSYFYLCHINNSFIEPQLEDYEREAGYKVVWIELEKALKHNTNLLKQDNLPKVNFLAREIYVLNSLKEDSTKE